MKEILEQGADMKTIVILLVGQMVLLVALVARKIVEYRAKQAEVQLEEAHEAKIHERTTLDDVMKKLLELEPMIRTTKAEMDIYREYIMGIPKLRADLAAAFSWLKTGAPPQKKNGDGSNPG